jgi:hypothetical protein
MSVFGVGSRIKGIMTHTILRLVACLALVTGCSIDADPECEGDHCVCSAVDNDCGHTCSTGAAECYVQGAPGKPVDVECDHNAECHVECAAASSCEVDCGGSAECHVTCPSSGCRVTNCSGPGCVVSCGFGEAPRNGTTATCP